MSFDEDVGTAISVVVISFSDFCSHGHLELIGSRGKQKGREVPEEPFVAAQVQERMWRCPCSRDFDTAIQVNDSPLLEHACKECLLGAHFAVDIGHCCHNLDSGFYLASIRHRELKQPGASN
jgi:hypothetical protein